MDEIDQMRDDLETVREERRDAESVAESQRNRCDRWNRFTASECVGVSCTARWKTFTSCVRVAFGE